MSLRYAALLVLIPTVHYLRPNLLQLNSYQLSVFICPVFWLLFIFWLHLVWKRSCNVFQALNDFFKEITEIQSVGFSTKFSFSVLVWVQVLTWPERRTPRTLKSCDSISHSCPTSGPTIPFSTYFVSQISPLSSPIIRDCHSRVFFKKQRPALN